MRHACATRSSGFTLIEMLVVLAILAALSLVALRSTRGLVDRARYDATTKALDAVEQAIVGDSPGASTSVGAGSFLADVGRLPNFGAADPTQRLSELWQLPPGMAPNHLVPDTIDGEVTLACGWRGPYLRLPIGVNADTTTQTLDGFGFPLVVRADLAGRWAITSPGADGVLDAGIEGDADVTITLPSGVDVATVSGTVFVRTAPVFTTWRLVVFAFEPDPVSGNLKVVRESVVDHEPTGTAPFTFPFSFSGASALTPGPRALRAYVFEFPLVDPDGERGALSIKSRIYRPNLLRGAQTLDLEIGG